MFAQMNASKRGRPYQVLNPSLPGWPTSTSSCRRLIARWRGLSEARNNSSLRAADILPFRRIQRPDPCSKPFLEPLPRVSSSPPTHWIKVTDRANGWEKRKVRCGRIEVHGDDAEINQVLSLTTDGPCRRLMFVPLLDQDLQHCGEEQYTILGDGAYARHELFNTLEQWAARQQDTGGCGNLLDPVVYRAECQKPDPSEKDIRCGRNNHQRDAMEGRWKFLHTLKRVFGEGVQAPSQGGDVSGDPDESKRLQHADHGGYATQHWFL